MRAKDLIELLSVIPQLSGDNENTKVTVPFPAYNADIANAVWCTSCMELHLLVYGPVSNCANETVVMRQEL